MIPLPAWVDREAFDEYVEMRRNDKKVMSPRSFKERLRELQDIKDAGYDVTYCIDAATNGHWLAFYAVERKEVARKGKAQSDWDRYQEEQRTHVPLDREAAAKAAALAKSAIRRVAYRSN